MKKLFLIGLIGASSLQSLAQSSLKLVVPIGHTRPITSLAVSPDDKFILSGGADNLIHMWSVESGRLLSTFRGHNSPANTIIISSSGNYFLSLDNNNTGFIRETFTGALIESVFISYHNPKPYSAATEDRFSWIDRDGALHHWSPGKATTVDKAIQNDRWAVSPNGKYMLTIGSKNTSDWVYSTIEDVYLIDMQTRVSKFLRKVQVTDGNQLGFSPDNTLALIGDDGNAVFAYQTQTGQLMASSQQSIWFNNFQISASGLLKLNCYDGTRVWDPVKKTIRAYTEKDESTFTIKNETENVGLVELGAVFNKNGLDSLQKTDWWMASRCKQLTWANDLYSLPMADWSTDRPKVEVLSRKSMFAYFKPGATKPVLIPATIAVKLHSKNQVVMGRGKNVMLFDTETLHEVKTLHGISIHPPDQVSFSPDNRSILYRDRWARMWNFNQSKLITLPEDSSATLKVVHTKQGDKILLVGDVGKIKFRNADNPSQLYNTLESNAENPFGRVVDMQLSMDEKFLTWTDDAGASFIKKMNWEKLDWYNNYRAISDTLVLRYNEAESGPTLSFKRAPKFNHLFLTGRSEVIYGMNMTWASWQTPYVFKRNLADVFNRTEIFMPYIYRAPDTTIFKFKPLQKFSTSADGNRVLFLNINDKTIRSKNEISWSDLEKPNSTNADYEREQGFYAAKERKLHYMQNPIAAAIHPTESWFAAGIEWDNDIKAIPLETGDDYKPFVGHTDWVNSIAFSTDGKFMASASLDNTVRIWDVETRQELVTLVTLGQNDWVVSHPSGLFDASPGAMNFIYFSTGKETIGLEQLKDRFYEPNLLKKALGGESLRAVSGLEKIDLYPSIRTTLDTLNAKLVVAITDQGGGIGKTSVFVNAKEVVEDLRSQTQTGSKGTFTTTIDLSTFKNLQWGDLNFIGVKAYNGSGYIASPVQKIYYQAPAKQEHLKAYEPKLYCLVVGVSDYQNDELDLKYSAKDAQDFAQAVTTAGKRLFGNRANITVLTSDSPNENLKPIKANIAQAMKTIAAQAQIDDLVIMYFSGHGTNLSGDDADFLYLTADARGFSFIDPAIRQGSTISSSELTEFMKVIPAQKQVLIFDACASGRMVENMLAKRDVPSSTLRAMERMKDRTGTYILTGCAADAVSYEASQFGQGLLTYSLLSGMKGAALRDNKFVDVLKLFQYAKEEVPKLAEHVGGIQEPKVFSPYGGESFDIGLLEDTDKKLIPLTEAKPFLVRSSFQNDVKLRDDLGLSKLIDQALAEQAISGKNAPFIFVDSQEFPGAIYISGRYKIENGSTVLKVVLFKDDKLMGSLDKTLNSSDPAKVQSAILEFVEGTVAKK